MCKQAVMHVIAAFESQIAAHGCALSIAGAARELGAKVCGAALARRDTLRGIHVDPVQGFEMPAHALGVLDRVFSEDDTRPSLHMGETALLVLLSGVAEDDVGDVIDRTDPEHHGARWVTTE